MTYAVSLRRTFALCAVLLLPILHAQAQTWRLPDDRKNTRHTTDLFDIPRPALSMRGFDNTRTNSAYHHSKSNTTYGVRQVLERAYGVSPFSQEGSVEDVYEDILGRSDDGFAPFTSSGNVEGNAQILESQAFMALVTFIIEENDGDAGEPNIFTSTIKSRIDGVPSHATARSRLITSLQARDDFSTFYPEGQPFKRVKALAGVTRALDLYYALENAYEDLGGPTNLLLSASDKQFWNDEIHDDIETIWQQTQMDVAWVSFGVQTHEIQAGNWPLISFAGLGYVVLGFNGSFTPLFDDDHGLNPQTHEDVLRKAMKSTAFHYDQSGLNERYNYWWYQTDAGKAFWAEHAYYFDITLNHILPFWHAIRANDFLSFGSGDGIDPFYYASFLNPIEWLAEIATPDGRTPPLDDGNKRAIRAANLLRWSSTYGNATTGSKFVWISEERGGYGTIAESRLVEIAIPRTASGVSNPPLVGNDSPVDTGEDGEQQMVLRRTHNGNDHYVFLNGESDSALENGEGHEQGDQMQLLYYVGETSYLLDAGYDDAAKIPNSTWNHYYDHNVMTGYIPDPGYAIQGDRGVEPPALKPEEKRIKSDHQNVEEIYGNSFNNIDLLSSKMLMRGYQLSGAQLDFADYRRKVLFINDPNKPYIVDLNGANGYEEMTPGQQGGGYLGFKFDMSYNGNSDILSEVTEGNEKAFLWQNLFNSEDSTDPSRTSSDLYVQPIPVEHPLYSLSGSLKVQEADMNAAKGDGVSIKRLHVKCGTPSVTNCLDHTTISFIRALPNSEAPGSLAKTGRSYLDENTALDWQFATWKHDNNTVDVVIARSAAYYRYPSLREDIDVAIVDAGNYYMRLPENQNYGFARLVNQGSIWSIDQNYQVHLVQGQAPPLEASISGPGCVIEDEQATWTADPPGGLPPYTYQWEYYIECGAGGAFRLGPGNECGTWNYGTYGTTFAYTPTSTDDLRVRLTVTDDAQDSDTETRFITVEADSPNACNNPRMASTPESLEATSLSDASVPTDYALSANYPNPFNPSTEIRFALPEAAQVSLVVYDVTGREVATLVDQPMGAGEHSTMWNASSLPSGTYLYRLTAGDFTQTKSMILMK